MATIFWNPSTPVRRARKTSAIPPLAIFSRSSYWPKRSGPSGATASRGSARREPLGVESARTGVAGVDSARTAAPGAAFWR